MSEKLFIEQILYILSSLVQIIFIYKHYQTKHIENDKKRLFLDLTVYITLFAFLTATVGKIFGRQQSYCEYGIAIGQSFYVLGAINIVIYQIIRYSMISYNEYHRSWFWRIYVTFMILIGLSLILFNTICTWIVIEQNIQIYTDTYSDCLVQFKANDLWYNVMARVLNIIYFIWDSIVILIFIQYLHKISNDSNQSKIQGIIKTIIICAVMYQTWTMTTTLVAIYVHMAYLYHMTDAVNIAFVALMQYFMHHDIPQWSTFNKIVGRILCCFPNEYAPEMPIYPDEADISHSTIIVTINTTNNSSTSTIRNNHGVNVNNAMSTTLYSHLTSQQQEGQCNILPVSM